MNIRRIQNAGVKNKKALLRVDFNVAVKNGKVKEKFKIEAAKDTIKYLLKRNCRVAVVSHLGRPKGKINPEFSFEPLADDINEILGIKIRFINDCVGEKIESGLDDLKNNEIILLENVRFYEEEEENNKDFSKKLADRFDIFINDAFSVCHRDQASVTGVTQFLPSYAGIRLQKEIEEMERIKNNFERPAVIVIGGAKIETKLPMINFFEKKYDRVLIGGKIANEAADQNIKFSERVILPQDFSGDRLDIGPKTLEKFQEIISGAKTIVWNGPLGKFEEEEHSRGTYAVLNMILKNQNAYSVVGGGETIEVLEKYGAMEKISFVSTGGGAMLEYLGGKKLPGIKALTKSICE